ncbi:MAG: L-threonine 3-dehydrogenase [Ignavibacteria bacterium GWA2_35_9]|nr:MAG: L-threonine 3-dehydrogenase [Ignavibacteria bacterium GWA2_35_9]OGU45378.1 MAG: L-threonine 3-dehydrogenase [Ignavibacteria bacterium GWB2_36_8]OGU52188.1 MAG: L-threonine 3-dehydrogenase [Ignavibacteria bacterium GWC2_36_12]
MKALVKKYDKPGIWMDEVPVPGIGINDVLIKIKKTSICGTDIHIYNWDDWAKKTIPVPMVTGHEYVGTVEAIGSNVHDVKIGELVSGEGHIVCGYCRNCRAGRRHLCPNAKGVGVNRPGCFAEYLSIPVSNIWHADSKIPLDVLSVFDPFGNATHTALYFNVLGEDVLITGAGPIGIMAAAICKHAGARYTVITDMNSYRLDLAKKIGVTEAVNITKENLIDVMKKLGMKEGFDVGLEMSGNPKALNGMIDVMSHGAKIALLGILPSGSGVDWEKVVFNGLVLKGIYGREMFETWYKMQVMVQSGLNISPLITHRFQVDQYQEAFELMKSGNSGKVILNWEGA